MAFAFFVRADGVLTGTLLAPEKPAPGSGLMIDDNFVATTAPGGSNDPFDTLVATPGETPEPKFSWQGVNSDSEFAPDGIRTTVPLNTWTKLTYVHDGIGSLRLYIDDMLVGARYDLESEALSVQGAGVHIGQGPHDERYHLTGLIDQVQICQLASLAALWKGALTSTE